MPPQQNTSIKSYPNPIGARESKCNTLATLTDKLDTHLEPSSTTQDDKVLGKRVASTPPRPTKKRKATTGDKPHNLAYKDISSSWLEAHHENRIKQVVRSNSLTLTYHKGDMFTDAPKGTLLIHACNTQGHWGAGIAKAFKTKYPNAYADHNKFCTKDHSRTNPVPTGTTQLLAPRDRAKEHLIGCIFTSAKHGKAKDRLNQITRNTSESMQMLLELVSQVDSEITEIRMCKINSGKFGVPWEKTEEVLQGFALKPQWRRAIEVWEFVE